MNVYLYTSTPDQISKYTFIASIISVVIYWQLISVVNFNVNSLLPKARSSGINHNKFSAVFHYAKLYIFALESKIVRVSVIGFAAKMVDNRSVPSFIWEICIILMRMRLDEVRIRVLGTWLSNDQCYGLIKMFIDAKS